MKNILYLSFVSLQFMAVAVLVLIYLFKFEASIGLLIQWFLVGIGWSLIFEKDKYFPTKKVNE